MTDDALKLLRLLVAQTRLPLDVVQVPTPYRGAASDELEASPYVQPAPTGDRYSVRVTAAGLAFVAGVDHVMRRL